MCSGVVPGFPLNSQCYNIHDMFSESVFPALWGAPSLLCVQKAALQRNKHLSQVSVEDWTPRHELNLNCDCDRELWVLEEINMWTMLKMLFWFDRFHMWSYNLLSFFIFYILPNHFRTAHIRSSVCADEATEHNIDCKQAQMKDLLNLIHSALLGSAGPDLL